MKASRTMALGVWFITSMFYAYQYILRVMPNIMIGDIKAQFDINDMVYGQYSGIYYIGYALLHLPLGILFDKYGPKRVMPICILLTVIGSLPVIFAENWTYPILGRFIIGVGSSGSAIGLFKVIRMVFADKHFARMLSFSVTFGLIGAIYGGGPVAQLTASMGYKAVIELFAIVGVVLAAFTYLLIPKSDSLNEGSVLDDLKEVLSNKKVLMICFFSGLMVGPLEGFADVWGAEFLKQVYNLDVQRAGYLASMIFVGMCFGAPLLSYLAERTGGYIASIIGSAITMLIVFSALVSEMLTPNGILIGFILVGVCCAYQILAIYKATTYVNENVAGMTTAFVNMVIMSFGYAFHSIIGFIVNTFGGAKDPQALIYGVSFISFALALAVIGFMLLAMHDRKVSHNVEKFIEEIAA